MGAAAVRWATPRAGSLLGVAGSSAAVLSLEVALTRVFAVTQFYHFAFLTVSLALLGFGASGSALAAFPRLRRGGPRWWSTLAAAQALATLGAYVLTNTVPFDSFSIAWDRRQVLYLCVYYVALTVPFFFGGAVIGVALTGIDQPVPIPSQRVYAASLAGSGAGTLVALGGLARLGGEGAVVLAALLAALGALAFAAAVPPPARSRLRVTVIGVLVVGLAMGAAATPGFLDMRLSPYKGLSQALRYPGAEIMSTRWDAAVRVDHLRSGGIRSLPGLSFVYAGAPPAQDGVTFDGDDLSPIPLVAAPDAAFATHMLTSLPFSLRPGATALILEPRGGLDVLVALASGSGEVVAVEPNGLAVRAARDAGSVVYDDPRVRVVIDDPRSYVERTGRRFDVVDLALTDPYRPVTSGAYSLAEDYSLTVEAFEGYLGLLEPGGVLAVARWVQTPPSEETRLLALAAAAARNLGVDPAATVLALRGYAVALVLVAPDGFPASDLAAVRDFAESRRFDLVAAPGLLPGESNRYNVLPDDVYHRLAGDLLTGNDPEAAYRASAFDIRPPTDDRPFFGHSFTWSQAGDVIEGLGRSWQPFGGAGYFVLLALLALSAVGAAVLIVAPLLLRRSRRVQDGARGEQWWTFGYFGLLGIGFLFVEIPLIQRYILLIGRPATALAVVLSALLLASGLGSLAAQRVPWRRGAALLTAAIVAYPFFTGLVTGVALAAPPAMRMAIGAAAIFPLGFLMGMMFPRGLARLEERAPHLIPWAWGVNGTMSVISAAASALLALTFGFTAVVMAGAACYGGAALLASGDQAAAATRPPAPVPPRG